VIGFCGNIAVSVYFHRASQLYDDAAKAWAGNNSTAGKDLERQAGAKTQEGVAIASVRAPRLPPLFFCNNLSRYKDNASNPDASRGWSSDRCALLGASLVDALSYVQPYLRHSGSFWESLPACDAYVAPRDIDGLPTHELNS
jgi:hypothetical protein